MSKKLNLIIKSCDECPYRFYDEEFEEYFCNNGEEKHFLIDGPIPSWCKLEDITIFDNTPLDIKGMRSLTKEESEEYNKFLEVKFEIKNHGVIPLYKEQTHSRDPICNP